MFYKKTGYPEENEIVLCTVRKILPHGVFVSLDEYKDKEGLIHISEISPGRIRNIRDFVKEGAKIVCRIIKINLEKNHIDLSLRRVTQSQRINKNTSYKQEQKAEKILELIAQNLNTNLEKIYSDVGNKLIENYGTLYEAFEQIREDPNILSSLKINQDIEKFLLKLIQEKIKKREVKISATITISSMLSNGVNIIKESLEKMKASNTTITYLGAPRYKFALIADNYKDAEKKLHELQSAAEKVIKGKGMFKLERND